MNVLLSVSSFWDALLSNPLSAVIVVLGIIFCGAELIKAINVWRTEGKKQINKKAELNNKLDKILTDIEEVKEKQQEFSEKMASMEAKILTLTNSDIHDIKAWIVEQYHKFYIEKKWIDVFHLETLDKRYEDYVEEGGNSYIAELVKRLHSLPTSPPDGIEDSDKTE